MAQFGLFLKALPVQLLLIPASIAVSLVPLLIFAFAPQTADLVAGLIDHYGFLKAALYLALAEAALGFSAWHWARAVLNAEPTPSSEPERRARRWAARAPFILTSLSTVAPFVVRLLYGQQAVNYELWMLLPALLVGGVGLLVVWVRREIIERHGVAVKPPSRPTSIDPLDPVEALQSYFPYLWRLLRHAPLGPVFALILCAGPFSIWWDEPWWFATAPVAALVSLALLVPVLTLVHATLRRLGFLQVAVYILLVSSVVLSDWPSRFPWTLVETAAAIGAAFLLFLWLRHRARTWNWLYTLVPRRAWAAVFATVATIIMLTALRTPK